MQRNGANSWPNHGLDHWRYMASAGQNDKMTNESRYHHRGNNLLTINTKTKGEWVYKILLIKSL